MQPVNEPRVSSAERRLHSWRHTAREAQIEIAHFRVSAAPALSEGVNAVSPAALNLPEDGKIALLCNKREFFFFFFFVFKSYLFFSFFFQVRNVKIPTCIHLTVKPSFPFDGHCDK